MLRDKVTSLYNTQHGSRRHELHTFKTTNCIRDWN